MLKHPFREPSEFVAERPYELLPFRFAPFDGGRYLLTNLVGEYVILPRDELVAFVEKELEPGSEAYANLQTKHFLYNEHSRVALDLLALKYRTQSAHLADFTGLHIFVVTLRCDHSCQYCQVSRQSEDAQAFDMSAEHAAKAVEFAFRSPSPALKFEFQGGEPLLNFPRIQQVVELAQATNRRAAHRRDLQFVIASNLTRLSPEILEYCREHDISFSTSLDGPEDLHDGQRPLRGASSHRAVTEGIRRIVDTLGAHAVSALMTTTAASLPRVREIIDEYVRHGLHSIFLRNLSPFGFARKSLVHRYAARDWLRFYEEGLDYVIELNTRGYAMREEFATILLQKMFKHGGSRYVDLQSPAGIGIAGIVYNYDGSIYASDEGRMLAETGDLTFCLGHLGEDGFDDVMGAAPFASLLERTMTEGVPMCSDCAYQPWCGSDPAFHRAVSGDVVGHKAFSAFCSKQMGVIRCILQRLESDPVAREVLLGWV